MVTGRDQEDPEQLAFRQEGRAREQDEHKDEEEEFEQPPPVAQIQPATVALPRVEKKEAKRSRLSQLQKQVKDVRKCKSISWS